MTADDPWPRIARRGALTAAVTAALLAALAALAGGAQHWALGVALVACTHGLAALLAGCGALLRAPGVIAVAAIATLLGGVGSLLAMLASVAGAADGPASFHGAALAASLAGLAGSALMWRQLEPAWQGRPQPRS